MSSPKHTLALLGVAASAEELLALQDQASAEAERIRATLRERIARYAALPDDPPLAPGAPSLLSWAGEVEDLLGSHELLTAAEAVLVDLQTKVAAMRRGPSKDTADRLVTVAQLLAREGQRLYMTRARAAVAGQPTWGQC